MSDLDRERLNVISEALASLVRWQQQTDARLARIEKALGLAEFQPQQQVPPTPIPPTPVETSVPPLPERQPTPSKPRRIETSVGLTWVNRIGVITLVLGVAFFFKYAVDNEWIGQSGRVLLGVMTGLAGLALAEWFWRRGHAVYAQGICGGGVATLYLSFFAAFSFYQLLGVSIAFLLMVVTTAVAGALSLRYNAEAVAALALLGGYATPLLLSSSEDRPWFLLGYTLVLTAAALAVARLRNWRRLEVLAFVAVAVVYLGWFDRQYTPEKRVVATAFVLVFYSVFLTRGRRVLQMVAQSLATLALLAIWPPPLLAYLVCSLAVAAGGLVAAERRNWPGLPMAALGAYWLFYGGWQLDLRDPRPTTWIFLLITLAFLLFFGWLPRRSSPTTEDLTLTTLNAAAYFAASYVLLDSGRGLLAIALAAVYVGLGCWLRNRGRERAALLLLGTALCFFTLAIPIQFAAWRITIAWSLEAAALAWISVQMKERRALFASLTVSACAVARLLLVDSAMYSSPHLYTVLLNARFLVFVIAAASLLATAWWAVIDVIRLGTYLAAHAVLLWGLILEVIGWCQRSVPVENLLSVETISISVLLAVYAALLVAAGTLTDFAVNRILGLGLIGLVVVKLYLYDVWLLERLYRIWAFAILGALLLVVSFLYSRHRSSVESWLREAKPKADSR